MIRVYHPFQLWEEIKAGMWKCVSERRKEKLLRRAVVFMSDDMIFGMYMKDVTTKWKYSCEHNLTDFNQNRIAWLGQAACALALGCPEDVTRLAWGKLTEQQRALADLKAENCIKEWEKLYEEQNTTRDHQMAIKGIL